MKHKKHGGHTGHGHEIAKAHGHVPDQKPKKTKGPKFGHAMPKGGGSDGMAHATHHAANAHHGMHDGMAPADVQLGYGGHMAKSHLGCNECHESDFDGDEGPSGDSGGGMSHAGGESSKG